MLSHHVIFHGRRICHARKPACGACPIAPLCPSYGEGETDPEKAKKLLKYEKGGFPGQRPEAAAAYPGRGRRRAAAGGRMRPARLRDGPRGFGRGPCEAGCRRWTAERGWRRHARAYAGRPVTVSKDGLPGWLDPVVRAAETVEPRQLSRFLPPRRTAGAASPPC